MDGRKGMLFGLDKCFVLVFNSRTKIQNKLPTLYLQGPDGKPYLLSSYYPEDCDELYLGFNPTDLIYRTKIDECRVHPHNLVPSYRKKPNPKYLKRVIANFNRTKYGTHQLILDKIF